MHIGNIRKPWNLSNHYGFLDNFKLIFLFFFLFIIITVVIISCMVLFYSIVYIFFYVIGSFAVSFLMCFFWQFFDCLTSLCAAWNRNSFNPCASHLTLLVIFRSFSLDLCFYPLPPLFFYLQIPFLLCNVQVIIIFLSPVSCWLPCQLVFNFYLTI